MASDPSSVFFFFLIPNQGYHIFLYGHTKYNREGGRKNKRTNTGSDQLQAQEREVSVALLFSFSCICRLSRACILHETSTKPLGILTYLWLSSLTDSCWPSFPGLLSQADRPPLPWFVTPLFVFSRTFLPSFTSGLVGDLVLRPFVWVSCQSRQRDSLTGTHTHQHNEWPHSVTKFCIRLSHK